MIRAAAFAAIVLAAACVWADTPTSSPVSIPATTSSALAAEMPIRAFHEQLPNFWGGDGRPRIGDCEKFIRDVLAPAGVNVLILEVGYNYQYKSCPKIGNPNAVGPQEIKRLLKVCRECGIKLIPELDCLGHQTTFRGSLLCEYPQFQEKPGKHNKYCTDPWPEGKIGESYCPLNPEVHKYVFALLDELADVFETDTIHVGMDEVFDIASTDCPLCAGKDPSELFAGEVKTLHDHLAQRGLKMWMWGDRLQATREPGYKDNGWEASQNGTERAVDWIPKDITICDWHYEQAPETPAYFARKGFDVIACCWREPPRALQQLHMMRALAADQDPAVAGHAKGVMLTIWLEWQYFIDAYNGKVPAPEGLTESQRRTWRIADKCVAVFKALTAEWNPVTSRP